MYFKLKLPSVIFLFSIEGNALSPCFLRCRENNKHDLSLPCLSIFGQLCTVGRMSLWLLWERKQDVKLDLDVKGTKRNLVSPESAMFCAHLSHFGYAVQLLPGRDFPTGKVMKKCPNHCSFSLFWRLSVDINGILYISISYLLINSIPQYE